MFPALSVEAFIAKIIGRGRRHTCFGGIGERGEEERERENVVGKKRESVLRDVRLRAIFFLFFFFFF